MEYFLRFLAFLAALLILLVIIVVIIFLFKWNWIAGAAVLLILTAASMAADFS